jgi:hypothetical protein
MQSSSLAAVVLRVAAGVALFGFMLLPQVSCGGARISGLDIMRMGTQAPTLCGLSWCVTGSAVLALLVPSVAFGVFGLCALMALLVVAKLDQSVGPMISIEPGAFVATLGFLVLSLKPKVNSVLVSSTTPPRREIEPTRPAPESSLESFFTAAGPGLTTQQPNQFCGKCGAKVEPGSRFCENCGAPQ